MDRARAEVAEMARQGVDAARFAGGLADLCGISKDDVLAMIAEMQGPIVDQMTEAKAADRLAEERAWRRANPAAARAWDHEED